MPAFRSQPVTIPGPGPTSSTWAGSSASTSSNWYQKEQIRSLVRYALER